MRWICFVLVTSCLGAVKAMAEEQGKTPVFLYSDMALGIGAPMSFKVTANCLFEKHHEIGIGYNGYWRRGHDIPDEYTGVGHFQLTRYPQETLSGITCSYAYVLYPVRSDRFRLLLRAGIFYGERSAPYNFKREGFYQGADMYSYERQTTTATALIFQPTLVYTPRRTFGATAGAYILLNKDMSGGGLTLGVQLGKVSNSVRHHKEKLYKKPRTAR